MKIISIVTLFCILCAATAYASWQDIFHSTYQEKGAQEAVIAALTEGASPEAIINEALTIQGIPTQGVLSSLYCSGADGDDIKKASEAAGITATILVAAYEQSVAECGDTFETEQANPGAGPGFNGNPTPGTSPTGNHGSSASPFKP